ncbi:MAG: GH3 auxin-responsive promoter family protein [Bacteroidales bacterium]|nr:GH3 auxin-responsive promoter family protein [Bacteroidales bacterium]
MAVVGVLLNGVVRKKRANFNKKKLVGPDVQDQTLKFLLSKARQTQIGKKYNFTGILESENPTRTFQRSVPVYDYEKIYSEWWHKLVSGEQKNVCWPGKVKYFGLTSGTSNDSSKRVPLTTQMIRSIRKIGIRQLLALADFDLPANFYEKSVLMLGGSTSLVKMETYFEGDLSGILAGRLPFWFNRFYKPGKPIAREREWDKKLDKIVKEAYKWDIGGISGVPAWVQILLERIIEAYGLKNIHEIWPNFKVYAHGGVNFDPYRKSFAKLLGQEVYFLETYLASEGFLAYQRSRESVMQLVLDNCVFFEFIPFNEQNFSTDGHLVPHPQTLLLDEVEEGKEYALLISTCAGAWRYLIGDTVKFTSVEQCEIVITGRTKHFLSLCGEHLSVDNMTRAMQMVSDELGLDIKEFAVAGIPYHGLFAHQWYLGIDELDVPVETIKEKLDKALKTLNDDYAVERKAALKEIFVEIVPNRVFYDYLKFKGKEGGQHKFPRVLNGMAKEWAQFITEFRNGAQ